MKTAVLKIAAIIVAAAGTAAAALTDGSLFVTILGWLAFALCAFLTAAEFPAYKDDKKKLIVRFVRATLVMVASEFAYDFCMTGHAIDWSVQSPVLSVWLGLIGLFLTDRLVDEEPVYVIIVYSVAAYITWILGVEFKIFGVLLVYGFYWLLRKLDKELPEGTENRILGEVYAWFFPVLCLVLGFVR